MTATSANMSYLLDEITSAVAINQFSQLTNLMGQLYGMRSSGKRRERSSSISGLGKLQKKTATVLSTEDRPVQQFQKTFLHSAFALHTPVERELLDDEDWGWFQDLGIQYAMSANRTMESEAALVFNDAFDGAETGIAEDGLSLCNSAHLNADGGNSQDNSGTSALSAANVGTTLTSMRKFTDYRGEKISVNPDGLVIPVDLEQTAWEIVRSSQKPVDADSVPFANYLNNRFALFSWNYLTDINNWFMVDQQMMRMHLLWYQRIGMEIFGDGDLFTGTRRIGIYSRWSNGSKDWRWVYGHEVA